MIDPEGSTEALVQPGEMEMNPMRTTTTTTTTTGRRGAPVVENKELLSMDCSSLETSKLVVDAQANEDMEDAHVYTAIPYEVTLHLDEEDALSASSSSSSLSSSLSSFIENYIDNEAKDHQHVLLRASKYHSLGLGVIIGSFIQLSCMGSIILFHSFATRVDLHKFLHLDGSIHSQITFFSFLWSIIASSVGFLIMLVLSRLLQRVQKIAGTTNNTHESFHQLHAEVHVATGAVLGVSVAWTLKSLVLGENIYVWQTAFTFGVAMLYAMAATRLLLLWSNNKHTVMIANNDGNSSLSTPLLENSTFSNKRKSICDPSVKGHSLVLGLLFGCLIQASSLAAHSFFQPALNKQEEEEENVLAVSIVWDLITSGLGVITLLLIRHILCLQLRLSDVLSTSTKRNILFQFESRFAMGTLAGVNLAWIATDVLLGMQYLIGRGLVTFAVSMLWCKWITPTVSCGEDETTEKSEIDQVV